ncbi:MAG: AcvB/VirJ family lysyl-phosphatidylglycerol hydrolase [Ginsengibacter sp.]
MKKFFQIIFILSFILFYNFKSFAQNTNSISDLPLNIVNAATIDTGKSLVMYITGDGGWNTFSKNLSQQFATKGYPVVSLNSKKYFWDKKTPEQSAADVTKIITTYQKIWNRKKILLVGYSFGADVTPFLFSHLSKELSDEIEGICLLSPSKNTDFEIHLLDMIGGSSGDQSVPDAINKISNKPITLLFGENENNFPLNKLTIKNYVSVKLTGGHHYDGDEETVCNTLLKYVPGK